MREFVIGVVSSLAATATVVMGGLVLSPRSRSWPALLLSRITGLGISKVLARQRDAAADLRSELARARWVGILAGRGNELTRDTFTPLWEDRGRRLDHVRVLLPGTDECSVSWLRRREDEIRRIDPGFAGGMLAEQIDINAEYVGEVMFGRQNIELRRYDLPHLHRIVVTDRVAFLTLYGRAVHGRDSPCLVAPRPGLLYDYALHLFTTAWRHADRP